MDKVNGAWMVFSLGVILILPLLIGVALYIKASPLFEIQSFCQLIASSSWSPNAGKFGFWPFIAGSIYVTALSFIFAAPVCLLSGIYLTQYASGRLI
ncbi:MAG TPA: hypothetical protein VK994_02195, partial [Bacteroidales bacterium]|nr:hypothetical protein [Bacteroidales bacterium]